MEEDGRSFIDRVDISSKFPNYDLKLIIDQLIKENNTDYTRILLSKNPDCSVLLQLLSNSSDQINDVHKMIVEYCKTVLYTFYSGNYNLSSLIFSFPEYYVSEINFKTVLSVLNTLPSAAISIVITKGIRENNTPISYTAENIETGIIRVCNVCSTTTTNNYRYMGVDVCINCSRNVS